MHQHVADTVPSSTWFTIGDGFALHFHVCGGHWLIITRILLNLVEKIFPFVAETENGEAEEDTVAAGIHHGFPGCRADPSL